MTNQPHCLVFLSPTIVNSTILDHPLVAWAPRTSFMQKTKGWDVPDAPMLTRDHLTSHFFTWATTPFPQQFRTSTTWLDSPHPVSARNDRMQYTWCLRCRSVAPTFFLHLSLVPLPDFDHPRPVWSPRTSFPSQTRGPGDPNTRVAEQWPTPPSDFFSSATTLPPRLRPPTTWLGYSSPRLCRKWEPGVCQTPALRTDDQPPLTFLIWPVTTSVFDWFRLHMASGTWFMLKTWGCCLPISCAADCF